MKIKSFFLTKLSMLVLGTGLLLPSLSFALDGIYLGGQVGYAKLSGDYSAPYQDAIGFGGDLGFRTNGLVDLMASYGYSNHSGLGGLTSHRGTLGAEMHLGQAYDFDFTVGAGPGFYVFKTLGFSETKFGLNFGAAVDAVVSDHFRLGLGYRFHAVFGSDTMAGSLWTLMIRAGYLFEI